MRPPLHVRKLGEESALLEYRAPSMPSVPSIVCEPLRLGQVPIPSRFFLAPLAGYTSLAFRLAVRECGGLGLATTDLVNARSLIEKRRRAFELAETCEQDRPLSIQIYGVVIAEMEQAARWVEEQGASAVDINMGCPVRKVVKGGGGSALMCQIDQAVDLVSAVVNAVSIPVTVKMRLGWDDESLTAPALAHAFEAAGVAALAAYREIALAAKGLEIAHLQFAFRGLTLAVCSRVRRDGIVEIEMGLGDPRLPKSAFTAAQMRQAEAASRVRSAAGHRARPARVH